MARRRSQDTPEHTIRQMLDRHLPPPTGPTYETFLCALYREVRRRFYDFNYDPEKEAEDEVADEDT